MTVQTRRLLAGFLAGASSVVGLLLVLMLILFSAGIWSLLQAVAFQTQGQISFGQAFGQALANTLAAMPSYFWSARWAMLALGLFGLLLAFVDGRRERVPRPWSSFTALVVAVGSIPAIVIGLQYASRETLQRWIADQPALFAQQDLLLGSNLVTLVVGVTIALALTYVVWATWTWWFERWTTWLKARRHEQERSTSRAARPKKDEYDWRTYQARQSRLRATATSADEQATPEQPAPRRQRPWLRSILAGLALATLAIFLVMRLYDMFGPAVSSGEMWLSKEAPQALAAMSFPRAPKRLTVSNTAGSGVVRLELVEAPNARPVRAVERMPLAGGADRFEKADLDLQGLDPRAYQLDARLIEGDGGLLRYIALYGGGPAGQAAAAMVGLAVGLWLALAVMALLELLVQGDPADMAA